jgi:hypothetical protein
MEAIVPFFFAFAAVFGIGMAIAHFRGKTTPQAIGVAHGVFALGGIAALLYILLDAEAGVGNGWLILGLFGLAALGGAYLFARKQKGKEWPGLVILAHGGTALAALILLVLWLER